MLYNAQIIGFLDFVHRLLLENTNFRKLDLFLFSGEGGETYSVGFLKKS
jgi:hypothetical protein